METATSLPTWIPDVNKFKLPEPPRAIQQALYDFDAQLVIIPSRVSRKFILARRRLYSAAFGKMVMTDPHPDTQMLYDHGLVDVAPLNWPGQWASGWVEQLIGELKARDIWRAGGPEQFIAMVEEYEAEAEIKKRRDLRDDFRHRAGDAWRSMQARIGARNKRASDYHGVATYTVNDRRRVL